MDYFLKGLRIIFFCGQEEREEDNLFGALQRDQDRDRDAWTKAATSSHSSHSYSLLADSDDFAQFGRPKLPWNYQSSPPVISTPFRGTFPIAPLSEPVVEKLPQNFPKPSPLSKRSPSAPPSGPVNYQKSSPAVQVWVESSIRSKEKVHNPVPHSQGFAPSPPIHVHKESDKKLQDKQPEFTTSHSLRSVGVAYVKKQDNHAETVGSQSLPRGSYALVDPWSSQSSGSPKKSPESANKKSCLPVYQIPKHLKDLIEKDKVPEVLNRPLSPLTYADYFAALLYAEDYYLVKWSKFLLKDVTLELRLKDVTPELHKHPDAGKSSKNKKRNQSIQKEKKYLVAFEIDSVPGRRPFLLSRDFVLLKPSGRECEPFQGVFFRVAKNTTVLVEFGDDFFKQHSPTKKYDVSFSFNRVCLKRAHHAVAAALDPCLRNILFPNSIPRGFPTDTKLNLRSLVNHIVNLKGPPPYLIEGPLSESPPEYKHFSVTGLLIIQAILGVYRTITNCRILIVAPRNRTCDALATRLYKEIPKSELFRANAAFREFEDVPDDILPSCLYKGECFTCPPLAELESFKVITSTFMSSFRLHEAGIGANHFTHIFMVDASSSTEPETLVALTNLVGEETSILVTGSSMDSPAYVRADIARSRNGLKRSYFMRLLNRDPYLSSDPMFITHL